MAEYDDDDDMIFITRQFNTSQYSRILFLASVGWWNSLPDNIVLSPNIEFSRVASTLLFCTHSLAVSSVVSFFFSFTSLMCCSLGPLWFLGLDQFDVPAGHLY